MTLKVSSQYAQVSQDFSVFRELFLRYFEALHQLLEHGLKVGIRFLSEIFGGRYFKDHGVEGVVSRIDGCEDLHVRQRVHSGIEPMGAHFERDVFGE